MSGKELAKIVTGALVNIDKTLRNSTLSDKKKINASKKMIRTLLFKTHKISTMKGGKKSKSKRKRKVKSKTKRKR